MKHAGTLHKGTDQGNVTKLQTYLTSLLYLRQEAQRDGLEPVAQIIWNAIAAVEAWLDTGDSPVSSQDVLDSPLCHSLDFMLRFLAMPPAKRRQAAMLLEDDHGETHNGRRKPRHSRAH